MASRLIRVVCSVGLAGVLLGAAACGGVEAELGDAVYGAVADQPVADKADDATIRFRVASGGYDYGLPTAKLQRETRRLFKSEASFRSYFGGAHSPGVDFTREWAVFYTPGTPNLVRGSMAVVRSVKLTSTGGTLKVTTRHLKPGNCAPDRARPFVIVAFPKPRGTPTTRYYKDDYTRSCGSATTAITPARFVRDLREHLAAWYVPHGADVRGSGGNTLAQAQAAVMESKVTELTDPEEDPEANDLTKVRVLRHPDIVWPGSDIVWHGAYDKATGRKLLVYDFN